MIILVWKNKFFLIHRDDNPKIRNPNTWAPVTGGMEAEDENITERAKKELEEEIGLIPKNLKTLGISEKGVGIFFARLSDEEATGIIGGEGRECLFFELENMSQIKLGGTFPVYLEKYPKIFKNVAEENYEPKSQDFELATDHNLSTELQHSFKIK